jgi:uncharacterized protein (DUF1778 family)
MQTQAPEDETLSLSLALAAKAARRSAGDFVLEIARERAAELLPDRRHFGLDAWQWATFMAVLEGPPREIPSLTRLLRKPSLFDRHETE